MLDNLKSEIKSSYYDPTFHGVDLDFVWEQARERVKTAPTRDALMMTLASAVLSLDDSHTTFFPPSRAADIEYGWRIGMIGNDCYITGVKPGTDAETKGLKVGDKVLMLEGTKPTRENLWTFYYRLFAVMPVSRVRMTIAHDGDNAPQQLEVLTRITKTSSAIGIEQLITKIMRNGWDTGRGDRYVEFGSDLMIWRMSSFEMSDTSLDGLMSKARNHKSLILDLRDNGGGAIDTLRRLIGYFFDHEVKICDEKRRKETKPLVAKSKGKDLFKGNLVVIVGHDSASAAEIFAKVIQLEKRGQVVGDRTRGAVMEARYHDMEIGVGATLYYGMIITMADLIMPDGKSLEKVGVTPDELVMPTQSDLTNRRDPVITRAAKILGYDITTEKAGSFFPYQWD
jgi:carboxyl-terminal processing protease